MDYCYACRRHLNGAYSCPGCGTPADQLKLPQIGETAQLPLIVDDDGEPGGPPFPGGGRAAARGRQRRKSRSRQQRAAVYGVGLVAVLGALGMLSMAALSGGGSGDTTPTAPVVNVTHHRPTGTASPDAAGSTAPHKGGSPGGPRHSQSPTDTPSTTSATPTAPATTAGPPATTPGAPPSATGAPPPTSPNPTHSSHPSPSPTCKQVLWWCQ
ncbi:hypothetical protein NMG29_06935 [Streptomyces cocklensis]|uniref:Uncharacterized protein n=1 Tax=Actinacidiphila cocklensis TaxID=887465 RepID=A0A9W4DT02_9ACTN|nr:hypothetical protein [Actinacidiphila cocklensis]MDD1057967.1 hypothetical protein [Actinacidiphila cocklensis]CAG6392976.1 conserved hypothetical protein [Actinacidiphila cocklensis]